MAPHLVLVRAPTATSATSATNHGSYLSFFSCYHLMFHIERALQLASQSYSYPAITQRYYRPHLLGQAGIEEGRPPHTLILII